MAIRFYIDADLLGLAQLLVQVRSDVTFPGDVGGVGVDGLPRLPCPIQNPGTLDRIWLPRVASEGWIIITRDRHLKHRPAELAAIVDSGARIVRLDAKRQLNKWSQLEIVVSQWRALEELTGTPGPWLYVATLSAVRREPVP